LCGRFKVFTDSVETLTKQFEKPDVIGAVPISFGKAEFRRRRRSFLWTTKNIPWWGRA
jgi:hypothetical protein